MSIHILGIRHHGPGSARHVRDFLERVRPDIVLVEGPPEADPILEWVGHAELKPPVAILAYQPDAPDQSAFYPFAEFSPEWQAMSYARRVRVPVKFMDLPAVHLFALKSADAAPAVDAGDVAEAAAAVRIDPMTHLAAAAGYTSGEKWWEHAIEYRSDGEQVFEAVTEAMQELRLAFPSTDRREEALREAYMRRTIRQAEKEMYSVVAVICGAWHVPALVEMPAQKADNELLKGLPKVKVECTWVPWTYSRLSYYSGYGAGIASPGWYEHVWNRPDDDGSRWMANVAKLFRSKNMDISVAHVIEAVRLANSLAALRGLSKAGLEELNEATLSVFCMGEGLMMQLVHDELIVSNRLGEVPVEIPKPPLQVDIEKLQKRLRLPPAADFKDYTLDLRKDTDLERSIFLHRLQLLGLKWGHRSEVSGKGTFKEQWRLQWDPAFSIDIIERGNLGNTVEEAAANFVIQQASDATALAEVCVLLENALPAEIPAAVEQLIGKINNLAAASADTLQLMAVIPGLVNVSRYGNVRKTDAELVTGIATTMIIRVCVSLPAACAAVDDEAAGRLLELFFAMNEAVNLLDQAEILREWQATLTAIAAGQNAAPMIAGYATRLLLDYKSLEGEELVNRFAHAVSPVVPPGVAAAWLEGFLKGSGTLLLIDPALWAVVNNWVSGIDAESFTQVLPLLRRTFSHYTQSERRKLGEKVRSGEVGMVKKVDAGFDEAKAVRGIPIVLQLLGIK